MPVIPIAPGVAILRLSPLPVALHLLLAKHCLLSHLPLRLPAGTSFTPFGRFPALSFDIGMLPALPIRRLPAKVLFALLGLLTTKLLGICLLAAVTFDGLPLLKSLPVHLLLALLCLLPHAILRGPLLLLALSRFELLPASAFFGRLLLPDPLLLHLLIGLPLAPLILLTLMGRSIIARLGALIALTGFSPTAFVLLPEIAISAWSRHRR